MRNILLAILPLVLILTLGCERSISQWRGVERDGIYNERALLEQWPGDGPDLLWVYEGIGRGFAAPAIYKEMVFVNGEKEGISYVFAFDLIGNLLWESPNGKEFLGEGFSSTYPGARSTPTVTGNLVYATSGQGRIACIEAITGEEKWATSIVDDLGGELGYFGYSESVAVGDGKIYCYPGGSETNLAALDKKTGKPVWTSPVLKDTFAYGSPLLVDLPSRKILITTSWHKLFTVDRKTGELLASYKLEGKIIDGEHCNTPVYRNGNIYFVANDVGGQGAMKLKLSDDGKSITEVWRNPEVMNNFGGFVLVNEKLFTMVRGNKLMALDTETGAITDSLKVDTGSLIFADNKFISYGNNGTVNLVNYKEGKLEIGGTMKIKEGSDHHFAHPVVQDGIMYIRHGNALMAYRIK